MHVLVAKQGGIIPMQHQPLIPGSCTMHCHHAGHSIWAVTALEMKWQTTAAVNRIWW